MRTPALLVLIGCFVLVPGGLFAADRKPSTTPGTKIVDVHGDPLPPGAVARLGSIPYRTRSQKFVGIDSPENRMATFTPDSQQVAMILGGDKVSYYEAATGRLVRDVWLQPQYGPRSPRGHLADNGLWAAVTDELNDGTARIRIWDLTRGELKNTIYHVGQLDPFRFYLSSDGKQIYHLGAVAADSKPQIRSWEVAAGTLKLMAADDPAVKAIKPPPEKLLSPDGKYRLEMTERVRLEALWQVTEVRTGKPVWQEPGQGPSLEPIGWLYYSPDGRHLAACQDQSRQGVFLWSATTGQLVHQADAKNLLWGLGFSPDGKQLGWAFDDIRLKDDEAAYAIFEIETAKSITGAQAKERVRSWLQAGGSTRASPMFWKFATGRLARQKTQSTEDKRINGLKLEPGAERLWKTSLSADGRFYVRVGVPKNEELAHWDVTKFPETISVWELASGERVARHMDTRNRIVALYKDAGGGRQAQVGEEWMHFVRLSADGRRVFLFGPDGLRVWNLLSGDIKPLSSDPWAVGWQAFAHTADVSADGCRLATGHPDGCLLIWDIASAPTPGLSAQARQAAWEELAKPGGVRAVWRLAADPDGAALFLRDRLQPATHSESGESLYLRPGAELQALRAVAVLEYIGTSQTKKILERLVAGEPKARLTQEATGALRRLEAQRK